MTKQVQRRRGTATQHTGFTGAEGEISVNTTNKSVHIHDGTTAGGVEAARADLNNVTTANTASKLSGGTVSSLTVTTADINGGTIDGVTIGGASAGAGTFTTLQANTSLNVDGTVTADGLTVDGDININSTLPKIQFTDTTGSQQSRLILNDDEIQLDNQSTGGIRLRTDNFKSRFLLASNGDISFYDTSNNPAFFWDASAASLGIGTSSPTQKLNVYSGAQGPIAHFAGLVADRGLQIETVAVDGIGDGGIVFKNLRTGSGSTFIFENAGSERMRIDSSGTFRFAGAGTPGSTEAVRFSGSAPASSMILDSLGTLLLGKTASGTATPGFQVAQDGFTGVTRDLATANSGEVFRVNRENTDGTIIDLRKDNSTVGSIGNLGTRMYIDGSGVSGINFSSGALIPRNNGTPSDGVIDIGGAANRFKNLYLSGGVYLGGTVAANYLDDYEEGTFTANYSSSSGSITMSGINDGYYVKVGRAVCVNIRIASTDVLSASGDLTITGLPFTSTSDTNCVSGLALGEAWRWTTAFDGRIQARIGSGSDIVGLYKQDSSSTGLAAIQISDMNNGLNQNIISLTGFYLTDS